MYACVGTENGTHLQNYLINARFIDNRPKDKPAGILVASEAEHSSFIGAVSLWHGDTRVEVSCDDYGKMSGKMLVMHRPGCMSSLQKSFRATMSEWSDS